MVHSVLYMVTEMIGSRDAMGFQRTKVSLHLRKSQKA